MSKFVRSHFRFPFKSINDVNNLLDSFKTNKPINILLASTYMLSDINSLDMNDINRVTLMPYTLDTNTSD